MSLELILIDDSAFEAGSIINNDTVFHRNIMKRNILGHADTKVFQLSLNMKHCDTIFYQS